MMRRNTTGCLLKMKLDKNDLDTPAITVNINSGESVSVDPDNLSFSPREKRPKSHDFSTDLGDDTKTSSSSDQHSPTAVPRGKASSDAGEFLCVPVIEQLPQGRQRSSDHVRDDSEDDYISGSPGESGSSLSSSEESEGENTTYNRERRAYRKRRYIIREILATENTYVRHLRDMVEGFFEPMELAVKSPAQSLLFQRLRHSAHHQHNILPTWEDLKEVFSNIVTIYELNDTFLSSLKAMQVHLDSGNDAKLQLGDAFLAVTDSFKFYSAFVNTYQASMDAFERMNQTLIFKELAKALEERGGRLSFSSLLVTPIQRIPRYLLLLRDLLNNTPPTHPDHCKLSVVLPKMEEVATYINTEKSKFDNLTVILNLSYLISGYTDSFIKPGRKFIREGFLKIYDEEAMKSKRRYFFLFSDILLMTRPKRGSTFFNKGAGRYQFMDSLQLLSARVQSYQTGSITNGLKVTQADGTHYILHTKEKEERVAWREALEEAIQSVWLYTNSTSKSRSHSLPTLWEKVPPSAEVTAVKRFKTRSTSVEHPSNPRPPNRKRVSNDHQLSFSSSSSMSSSPLSSQSLSSSPTSSLSTSVAVSGSCTPLSPRLSTPAFSIVQSASSALNRLTSRARSKDKLERKTRRRSASLTSSEGAVPVQMATICQETQAQASSSVTTSNEEVRCRDKSDSRRKLSRSLTATDLLEATAFDQAAPVPPLPLASSSTPSTPCSSPPTSATHSSAPPSPAPCSTTVKLSRPSIQPVSFFLA